MKHLTMYFFLAIILPSVGITTTALAQQVAGIVKIISGDARLVRDAHGSRASVGDAVHVGDRLETGANGALGVTLKDGTLLSLGANSAFVIEEFLFEPERNALSFIGSVRAGSVVYTSGTIGRLAPAKVRVDTPFGTIGTRGTRFAVLLPTLAP